MNSLADSTRLDVTAHSRVQHRTSDGAPMRSVARRIASWWSDDPTSAVFSSERERDLRMLRRQGVRS